jgi:hypothetical protein
MVRANLLVIALASVLSAQSRAPKVFTLCQLFQDLDSHDGKRVTIRATYRFGQEISALYGAACEIMLDNRIIQPAVWVESLPRTNQELNRGVADARTKPIVIVLTATGTLRTHNPQLLSVQQDGTRVSLRMFGHLGAFPAELRIESIDKVEISVDRDDPSYFDLGKARR